MNIKKKLIESIINVFKKVYKKESDKAVKKTKNLIEESLKVKNKEVLKKKISKKPVSEKKPKELEELKKKQQEKRKVEKEKKKAVRRTQKRKESLKKKENILEEKAREVEKEEDSFQKEKRKKELEKVNKKTLERLREISRFLISRRDSFIKNQVFDIDNFDSILQKELSEIGVKFINVHKLKNVRVRKKLFSLISSGLIDSLSVYLRQARIILDDESEDCKDYAMILAEDFSKFVSEQFKSGVQKLLVSGGKRQFSGMTQYVLNDAGGDFKLYVANENFSPFIRKANNRFSAFSLEHGVGVSVFSVLDKRGRLESRVKYKQGRVKIYYVSYLDLFKNALLRRESLNNIRKRRFMAIRIKYFKNNLENEGLISNEYLNDEGLISNEYLNDEGKRGYNVFQRKDILGSIFKAFKEKVRSDPRASVMLNCVDMRYDEVTQKVFFTARLRR
jgi:hypothetical protein